MSTCVLLRLKNRTVDLVDLSNRIRRVNSIHNQLKKEALREKNIRNMLNEHMGYVFDAYKPEEVESV